MTIQQSEIKFYKSTNGLGGAITANEIVTGSLHDVFDLVGSDGAASGEVNYRCIYVANTNISKTFQNAVAYILSNTPLAESNLEIGLGTSPLGGTEQTIPNESTAPAGVSFVSAPDVLSGLALGNIPFTSHKAIWVKRTITAGAPATGADAATIAARGETVGDAGGG